MTRSDELDRLRTGRSEAENHYIDELLAGRLDRREFLRRGSVLGMSASLLGAVLAACGNANPSPGSSSASSSSAGGAKPTQGGSLTVASQVPAAAVNPITVADSGGLAMLAMTGEFLILDDNLELALKPMLATSWKPNADGSMWTFKLRPNVKFHNGATMTADDVVYTFKQLSDPKNASNALSNFSGVLTPAGVRKVDSLTVAFHLEAPNGNFPYLASSDNYNAIIVPAGTDFGKWQQTFIGTGPFKMTSYTQNVGASFVANPDYWGAKPLLSSVQWKFYPSQEPQLLALQGGEVDVVNQFVAAGASALLRNPSYTVMHYRSANHRELSMRCDRPPFNDPRVRQAVALTLNRPQMVSALLFGYGTVANDYPFGPRFPSTNTSVPQRTQDLAKARQLLSAAGHPNGFSTTLTTEIYQEIPELAQVIKAEAAKAGINMTLKVETQSAYYGKATYGNSDWLDAIVSLVDYGDRGAPNVYLEAPLTSNGPWNAAHFKNPTYDRLVKQYVAALDLQSQRRIAGEIERLLLAETPIVIPYWMDGLTASTPKVHGLNPTAMAQLFLDRAYKSA